MKAHHTLNDIHDTHQTVLLRVDLNMPISKGKFTHKERFERILPTLFTLRDQDHKIVIISHLGRPEGIDETLSLKPIMEIFKEIDIKPFFANTIDEAKKIISTMKPKDVLILENIRFFKEEEINDQKFAKKLASMGDIYVNEAFSCSHRPHASIVGIPNYIPAYMGESLSDELRYLHKCFDPKRKPLMSILGGAKISSKIHLLNHLIKCADYVVLGGGMANTFLAALGHDMGDSLIEKKGFKEAIKLWNKAQEKIILPIDGITDQKTIIEFETQSVPKDMKIMDIGPKTIIKIQELLASCKSVIWNGPMGVFEKNPFHQGTKKIAKMLADDNSLTRVVGGGDTLAAIGDYQNAMTHASTAGGAFLEYLEGDSLPGLKVFGI
jgi:phosphoglycerate kinase